VKTGIQDKQRKTSEFLIKVHPVLDTGLGMTGNTVNYDNTVNYSKV